MPHFPKYRTFARLLKLEGQVKAGQNDWKGAIDSYLDGIQLGNTTPKGGTLTAHLVGIASQNIARQPAWMQ